MGWALAEVAALATKAARGAGAPSKQAARFGTAAAFHLAQGRPVETVQLALAALPEGPILRLPVLLQSVLAIAKAGDESLTLRQNDDLRLLQSYLDTLPFTAKITAKGPERVEITVSQAPPTRPKRQITGCDGFIFQLTALAARDILSAGPGGGD